MVAPWTYAQDNPPHVDLEPTHWYTGLVRPYQPRIVAPVNVSNSGRIDSLLRAGNLYLSLPDAIALALENNLDIEVERYEFAFADADLLRAKSGASILGIPTGVSEPGPHGRHYHRQHQYRTSPPPGPPVPWPHGGSLRPVFTSTVQDGATSPRRSRTPLPPGSPPWSR